MTLQELLKKFLEEDKITSLLEEMKTNKIFTASEENLDIRYKDLQDKFTSKEKELTSANELITSLKETNKGNEDLQNKISNYDTEIANLRTENEELKIENAIKVGLLSNKAKPEDLDYLIFKLKQTNEFKLDDKGNIKNFDFKDVKVAYPNNFETESKKEVDINNLPKIKEKDVSVTKEQFNKMSYKEKNDLYKNDPDTYKKLSN